MALNKSKDLGVLVKHLVYIAACMLFGFTVMPAFLGAALTPAVFTYVGWYCLIHGIQDWFIWRGYQSYVISKLGLSGMDLDHPPIKEKLKTYKYYEDKVFYDFIGLDRLLHVITMVVLYGLILL